MADGEFIAGRLQETFPHAVVSRGSYRDQHWVAIRGESLVEIAAWLKNTPEANFEFLTDVTAVHWPGEPEPMEMIYHLYSFTRNDRLRLKVRTGETGPVPSLQPLWDSAEWNERETFDMFGIVFTGHPDLRRILMPDDYTDFPLRKEFPLYRG